MGETSTVDCMESNPHFVITMTSLKDNGSESKCLVGKPQNNRRREHHSRRMANRDLQTCKARKWGQSQLAKGQRGYQFHACRPLHGVPRMHGTATCHARILFTYPEGSDAGMPSLQEDIGGISCKYSIWCQWHAGQHERSVEKSKLQFQCTYSGGGCW